MVPFGLQSRNYGVTNLATGTYTTSSTSFTLIDNMTIALRCSGKTPVMGFFISDGGTGAGEIGVSAAAATDADAFLEFRRNGNLIDLYKLENNTASSGSVNGTFAPSGYIFFDATPPKQSNTYTAVVRVGQASDIFRATNLKLAVFEL